MAWLSNVSREAKNTALHLFVALKKSPQNTQPGFTNTAPSLLVCAPSDCSPLGSQRGCRRQAWHTAGWVGAGSQLGPEKDCQARRSRGMDSRRLCSEPCLQVNPAAPALHAPAAAVRRWWPKELPPVCLVHSLPCAPIG